MRTWVVLRVAEKCGACGNTIPDGFAAIQIELRGVKRKLYRGECCAGAAPPNLPAQPVLQSLPKLDLSRLDALVPERKRGALKEMARDYLPPEIQRVDLL